MQNSFYMCKIKEINFTHWEECNEKKKRVGTKSH